MTRLIRIVCLLGMILGIAAGQIGIAQEVATDNSKPEPATNQSLSADEIRALLDSIDPYKPEEITGGEIDIFGSTSMDVLAHSWATEFKQFHPDAKFVISAEGSETVIDRLSKSPASIGMLSRPVSDKDLERLKAGGMKHPVAIQVAREPLGVYVHTNNPLEVITYPQLVALFCSTDAETETKWSTIGVSGELGDKPIHIIGRDKNSGTRAFIENYLFHGNQIRKSENEYASNSEVLLSVGKDPNAIAITEFKCCNDSVRRLKLRDKSKVLVGDEHEVLLGRYPITRPLTLVFDLEGEVNQTKSNREFVSYALAQCGQANTILAGFFPFDPPTLRAELSKLNLEISR